MAPGRKLGRSAEHLKSMLRNQVTDLIMHGRIETTREKAKELVRPAEKIVTLAKRGDESSRRAIQGMVFDKAAVEKAWKVFPERYADRAGGYTRVLTRRFRARDNARMAYIEFIDRDGELRTPRPGRAKEAAEIHKKEHEEMLQERLQRFLALDNPLAEPPKMIADMYHAHKKAEAIERGEYVEVFESAAAERASRSPAAVKAAKQAEAKAKAQAKKAADKQ